MLKRWLVYILIGIVFGVFDFYYQAFISDTMHVHPLGGLGISLILPILEIGIWLAPIIPIVVHEARLSTSSWLPALASALTWSTSVAAYYLTNAFQLAIMGVPGRPELHISNHLDPYFWSNWRGVFFEELVANNVEWIIVAVIGGAVTGFLLSFLYRSCSGIKSDNHKMRQKHERKTQKWFD